MTFQILLKHKLSFERPFLQLLLHNTGTVKTVYEDLKYLTGGSIEIYGTVCAHMVSHTAPSTALTYPVVVIEHQKTRKI